MRQGRGHLAVPPLPPQLGDGLRGHGGGRQRGAAGDREAEREGDGHAGREPRHQRHPGTRDPVRPRPAQVEFFLKTCKIVLKNIFPKLLKVAGPAARVARLVRQERPLLRRHGSSQSSAGRRGAAARDHAPDSRQPGKGVRGAGRHLPARPAPGGNDE